MSKLEVYYRRFFKFGLISLIKIIRYAQNNIISTDADITHVMWKKRFSIFEKLLKASGITTKVLSCLKIPLTNMRVDGFAGGENFVPRLQTSSILSFPPHPLDRCLNPPLTNSSSTWVEELYYSFYFNEGLENKLTRVPLLSLAKSIHYIVNSLFPFRNDLSRKFQRISFFLNEYSLLHEKSFFPRISYMGSEMWEIDPWWTL